MFIFRYFVLTNKVFLRVLNHNSKSIIQTEQLPSSKRKQAVGPSAPTYKVCKMLKLVFINHALSVVHDFFVLKF